uniref:TPX2 C-terminal domain-containing protein n=1 Tax=Davidia involucrata TaxID=16924 RepID=A0A5B6ZZH4_DAVIN
MGEFSACLTRSFSHPSDTSREAKEGDPLRALGESISFGRFMSESLAWEKWSAFSHNRYLEEVEKFSKPGSVAQKKAYFEAHYKKIAAKKAAALLEQENEAANNSPKSNIMDDIHHNSSMDSELAKSECHVTVVETQVKEASSTEPVDANGYNLNIERNKLETSKVQGAESTIGHVITESPIQVELSNQIENVENHSKIIATHQEEKALKDAANQGDSTSTIKKNKASSSSKLTYSGASKLRSPAKLTTPIQDMKEENATPNSKKSARDFLDKKRSTPKSLHMSINFSSHAGETSKTSSPILQKLGNSRIVRTFVKTSKDSLTLQRNPTKVSVTGVSKRSSVTPQPENRRTKTLLDRSVSGSRTVNEKLQSLSRDRLESSSACGSKAKSPIISSSFIFRSGERVAKRKEFFQKLEEKLNAKEAEKVQLQTKSKEKAEKDFKKMRQNIGFTDKPITIIPHETESPNNHMKKIPLTRPRSPKLGRKPTPRMVQDTSSHPRWRPPVKTDGSKHVTGKNNRTPTCSINSPPKKNTHENASPNIQV